MPEAGLPKEERLCTRNGIGNLLGKGRWASCGFIRYCYISDNGAPVNRLMVSVPKKLFRRAVRRNLLKRRLRESYRQQKGLLPEAGIDLLLLYNTKEIKDFQSIYETVGIILKTIGEGQN